MMNPRSLGRRAALLAFCLALVLIPAAGPLAGEGPLSLTIAHLNDSHSQVEPVPASLLLEGEKTYLELGGAARLAAKLEEVRTRSGEMIFLHAGDAVQGTIYFTRYQGRVEMDLLNALKCTAMALGNHEFDRGPEVLGRIVDLAEFPILAANLEAGAEPALKGKVRPYLIREVKGRRVGIIGLVTSEVPVISSPGPRLRFLPVEESARRYVAELQAQGIDKIVLLTHLGFQRDVELARAVEGVDLIVGGHSHSLLGDREDLSRLGLEPEAAYPTLVQGPTGLRVAVVQAWAKTRALGLLEVGFDAQGVVEKVSGRAVLLAGGSFQRKGPGGEKAELKGEEREGVLAAIKANPALETVPESEAIQAKLAPYQAGVAELQKEVVARVAQDLDHHRSPGAEGAGGGPARSSQAAALVCESMLWKVNQVGLKADLALNNAGGVRTGLQAGELTVGQVYSLLPFGNTLVVLELTGGEIREALRQGVGRSGGAFPCLAGARLVLDQGRPVKVELRRPGGWQGLEEEAIYRVVTNSFLAQGGDGYQALKEASRFRYDTGFIDAQVFLDYAREVGTLKPVRPGG